MIFMMTRQKSGVSMMSLQRMLGISSYKTVWTMGHKIRKAMAARDAQYHLAGLVEMDDIFLGPRKPGGPGGSRQGKDHGRCGEPRRSPVICRDETRSGRQERADPGTEP